MNLRRLLWTSLIVLVISIETKSGIIFSLLMKVLLLKGALFMTMPLSLGAFMFGQGMGFFAGNMMGGYMMLRAANRYHTNEKVKWSSSGGGSGGYSGGYSGGGWGWKPTQPTFHDSYAKGKDIGSALHALTSHKTKIASALTKVKGLLGWKKPPVFKGWGHRPPVFKAKAKGWGWGGPSHQYDDHDYDFHYTAHTKHQPTKYVKVDPYGHLKGYEGKSSGGHGKGGYSNDYYPLSVPEEGGEGGTWESAGKYSKQQQQQQDPSNTYYSSAYDGPGHEYTGILTDSDLKEYGVNLHEAQEKSSSEDIYSDIFSTTPKYSPSTPAPNPLLERYLEQRLREEAEKHSNTATQEEAKELIQMLRKAYLKQLVDSLKEEENVLSSTERGARSFEETDRKRDNIIQQILNIFPAQGGTGDMFGQESVVVPNVLPVQEERKLSREDVEISDEERVDKPTESSKRIFFVQDDFPKISNDSFTTSTENTLSSSTENVLSSSSSSPAPVEEEEEAVLETEDFITENDVSEKPSQTISSGFSLQDLLQMPGLWTKTEETITDENIPLRVRRSTSPQGQGSSPPSSPEEAATQITSFVEDIKKFFTLLSVLDQDQCLQKLVCDVHTNQKDVSTLTQYETNLLTTFRLMKALMPEGGAEDSSTKYRRAALIGETGQSLELCQQTYVTCSYSSSQIINLGAAADASPSDWAQAEEQQQNARARSEYVTEVKMPRVRRRSLRSFYI